MNPDYFTVHYAWSIKAEINGYQFGMKNPAVDSCICTPKTSGTN